jgi:hypothetical protein
LKRDDAKNCDRTYNGVTCKHDCVPLAGYSLAMKSKGHCTRMTLAP